MHLWPVEAEPDAHLLVTQVLRSTNVYQSPALRRLMTHTPSTPSVLHMLRATYSGNSRMTLSTNRLTALRTLRQLHRHTCMLGYEVSVCITCGSHIGVSYHTRQSQTDDH